MAQLEVRPADATPQAGRGERSFLRSPLLWLVCGSHAVDHFQYQMLGVLYPLLMVELGVGFAELGVITATRTFIGNGSQVIYGFLVPFARRTRLLALGNLLSGLAVLFTSTVTGFASFTLGRAFFALGSSAQHPIGSSMLSGAFPRHRGTALALNSSMAGIGGLLAPTIVGTLVASGDPAQPGFLGWRQIFVLAALLSLGAAAACVLFRRSGGAGAGARARRGGLSQGKASYVRVLRNRNIVVISLVMMAGASGRGDGAEGVYLGPHLARDLGLTLVMTGVALSTMQAGHIAGALGFGWLSDRLSRKPVMQGSLLMSAIATWCLAYQGAYLPILLLNMFLFGMFTGSRNSLTQALVADSLSDADRDAGFSIYFFIGFISAPIWALITGFVMQAAGFSTAYTVLGFSYLAGMLLLFLVDDPRSHRDRTMPA